MPRRDDTFIIYYAEDFTEYETSNPSNLYCLSQSSIDVILSALRFATWPTRWRTDRDDYRGKVSVEEWGNLRKWGELAIQEVTYEMGCDINEGLTNIANALTASASAQANAIAKLSNSVTVLANAQCCELPMGGTGGVQGTVDTGDTGPIPIYGETPLDTGREPGTFPPEFEDEPSYLANKCAVANLIVDGVTGTLHGFATFTVFNATALVALIALATASIIIMPPVAIPVMVGCILALVGFTTYFEGMADEIQSRRDEYVCILYEGETIEIMISLLADFIDAVLAIVGGAGWITRILKQVFLLLNNPDTLKQLFDGVAGASYPGADCSDCGNDCELIQLGELDSDPHGRGVVLHGGPDYYRLRSVPSGGEHLLSFFVNILEDNSDYCGDCAVSITFTDIDNFTPSFGDGSFYHYGCPRSADPPSQTAVYNGSTIPICNDNVSSMYFRSSTEFEVEFTVSDEPCA